jgi:hypothetical protein
VNQVGYEIGGPKRFVCRSEENLGPTGRFEVTDGTGRTLLEGSASRVEPAESGGPWHYPGNFSSFREAGGDFRIRFEAGNRIETSRRFGVGSSILRRLTMPLLLLLLRSRRFGRADYRGAEEWTPPGMLPEDEHFYDTGGGWFDVPAVAGASLRTGVRTVCGLFLSLRYAGWRTRKGTDTDLAKRLRARGKAPEPQDPQALEELRRGADWFKRLMIRYPTSGEIVSSLAPGGKLRLLGPGSHAEPHLALMSGFVAAKMAEVLADNDLLRRGERFWEEYREGLGGMTSRDAVASMLLSEIALHVATLEPRYLAAAEGRAKTLLGEAEAAGGLGAWRTPGISMPVAALVEFTASLPDHPLTPGAKEVIGRFLNARVEAAKRDPFGLVPHGEGASRADLAMHRAGEAWQAVSANRVTGRPAYVELATDAMNWILGLNPEDECLLLGAGAVRQAHDARVLSLPKGAGGRGAAGPAAGEVAADMGAVLAAPGSDPASADTAAAATYLMALALI